ncbi:hypothetical protein [Acidisphaera sp. L21]|uniref:hypothetical protein n=1 Tax=Acidisphaera sp. L21 TaxID=1641851 RepID=UPI00131C88E2|nr:hypothetical protein [Acidisphaera sp. L21]
MPTQSDAETALTELAAAALYPNGTAADPAIASTIRLYRGWPNATALDADLAAGNVNITVFPVPGATRLTTRYTLDWMPDPVTPTLTVSVTGNTVTFAGSADAGQLAGILVEGKSYVHRTIDADNPALVAAILAAAINPIRPATAAGTTVTIPNATSLVARTAADASANLELRRQQQEFRVTAWCPTPDLRDATCNTLDITFAATPFLTLPDGSAARLRYVSTTTFDQRQDAALYRRDLLYTVEFPTTQVATQPSMLFGTLGLGASVITA